MAEHRQVSNTERRVIHSAASRGGMQEGGRKCEKQR